MNKGISPVHFNGKYVAKFSDCQKSVLTTKAGFFLSFQACLNIFRQHRASQSNTHTAVHFLTYFRRLLCDSFSGRTKVLNFVAETRQVYGTANAQTEWQCHIRIGSKCAFICAKGNRIFPSQSSEKMNAVVFMKP